ncbi:hypothetical protein PBI_RICH_50 [Mycobacterium phage Rich]|uniref:Uncharacterized protein n=1 Tax=Mycobacterium phage Rich TaxID=1927021 RepID=A0A1L6BYZ0_9CAUD|nr:hypothetical protein PBI_RICH_50 [Mycobacterium phage Rich]
MSTATPQTAVSQANRETPTKVADGSNLLPDQRADDAQAASVGEGQTTETGTGQELSDTHRSFAGAGLGPILDDPTLRVLAEAVDDLETVRKANDNRRRQLTRCEADKDGVVRGHCLPEDSKTIVRLSATLDLLAEAEKQAVRNLEATMATHPLGPWVKAQNGLGLKTIARLLSAVGDPYWNTLHDRPRTVSELWAYAGLAVHDGAIQRRAKGQRSNWSDIAKMRVWNCVQPIIKNARSPYRALYDAAKAGYLGATHTHECKQCGPKGAPAQPGSPLSKGHIDARAQRVVMKAILKDLWIESKRIHEEVAACQSSLETHPRRAGGDLT